MFTACQTFWKNNIKPVRQIYCSQKCALRLLLFLVFFPLIVILGINTEVIQFKLIHLKTLVIKSILLLWLFPSCFGLNLFGIFSGWLLTHVRVKAEGLLLQKAETF